MSNINYLAYFDRVAQRIIKVIEGSEQHLFVVSSSDYDRRPDKDIEQPQVSYEEGK